MLLVLPIGGDVKRGVSRFWVSERCPWAGVVGHGLKRFVRLILILILLLFVCFFFLFYVGDNWRYRSSYE